MSSAVVSPADSVVDFASLGLNTELVATAVELGYTAPTPIQEQAIVAMLAGQDVLGQAATGTGKTAAFGLPIVQLIAAANRRSREPQALVLVPTRELAMQVAGAIERFAKPWNMSVLPIYGGQPMGIQLRALKQGVDIVVATPGRALDLLNRGALRFTAIAHVVLDEADEMLDMGFAEDLDAIFAQVPEKRQTALFSATLPPRIADMASRHLKTPTRIKITPPKAVKGASPLVEQRVYFVPTKHKADALARIVDMDTPTSAIVFCRTRQDVDALSSKITERGYRGEALHGGLSQEQRDRVMQRFRDGITMLLIATDVAARGLDIDHVSHVFNYDVPGNAEVYVHRIGRTGRAGRSGVAITFAQPRDRRILRNIENLSKTTIKIATVPKVADVQARRLEVTRTAVQEAMVDAGKDRYRTVVESLAASSSLLDVACAALKLLHGQGERTQDTLEIPSMDSPSGPSRGRQNEGRPYEGRQHEGRQHEPRQHDQRGRGPAREATGSSDGRRRDSRGGWEVASLFFGAGHDDGIRPADLVGCIANELDLDSRAIGAIQIGERFSLVEVPAEIVDDMVQGLRGATIKGKRVTIRRDREMQGRRN